WEPVPCASFEAALAAVQDGTVDLAMIPIDNSIAGRVADIHHFLPRSGLHIIGEYFLPIHFDLLGVPGSSLETVKTVHSHVHALGQCRRLINEHGFAAVTSGDTAGAAREVAEWGDVTRAALAPPLAAEVYGLDTLARNVEDAEHNTTRFVILARESQVPEPSEALTVTTFVFRVRNLPAALYKALGGFATNGINMTKLESYMENGTFTATFFYAEVDGRPEDRGVARAFEELQFFSGRFEILGVYPADPFRTRG